LARYAIGNGGVSDALQYDCGPDAVNASSSDSTPRARRGVMGSGLTRGATGRRRLTREVVLGCFTKSDSVTILRFPRLKFADGAKRSDEISTGMVCDAYGGALVHAEDG